jgi:hypothetical protein
MTRRSTARRTRERRSIGSITAGERGARRPSRRAHAPDIGERLRALHAGRVTQAAATSVALIAVAALAGCRERETVARSVPPVASAGELAAVCPGDSLRPATAAPAPGLWLYERPSGERVAAMIGPPRSPDGALVVTRPVETMEVSASRDTIRHRIAAATVSLELVPPLRPSALGSAAPVDPAAGTHPAASYALSARVRLAAYEPCATSGGDPRIRYLRRDATGRVVTDVLLRRVSER